MDNVLSVESLNATLFDNDLAIHPLN